MCLLTSWASAGGRSVGARQAGGVVQARVVEKVAGVVRQVAEGPAEERRTGAGELPGDVRLQAPTPVQTRRRVALVHVDAAVDAHPARDADTPRGRRQEMSLVRGRTHIKSCTSKKGLSSEPLIIVKASWLSGKHNYNYGIISALFTTSYINTGFQPSALLDFVHLETVLVQGCGAVSHVLVLDVTSQRAKFDPHTLAPGRSLKKK